MPLANRTVLPSWLGRRSISEEDSTEENSLTAVSHNAVLGTIIQLASLVRHADDIFCDLAEECQLVFEKAESITHRIKALDKTVKQLDSTEVNIRKLLYFIAQNSVQ
ncbi:wiskott-aldrich syndrome protein family member 3 [Plakobranchus ocellatus]|uniref:Wiskott-aldrich syndrome protein family member 3 n=1 Tax=Plakobranchus ocellatus TaxID=259542 RepID=A0AAV4B0T3_9GAST|nr:wiskott-aldrich syndrome protein family member 3 [Plakobranchus ocellatus]